MIKADRFYSISEAAQKLGVSISTLRRWEREGKISIGRTPGGKRLFSEQDLELLSSPIKTEIGGVRRKGINFKIPTFKPSPRLQILSLLLIIAVLSNLYLLSLTPLPNKAVLGVKDFITPALSESAPLGSLLGRVQGFFKGGSFILPLLGKSELAVSDDLSVKGKGYIAKDLQIDKDLKVSGIATVGKLVTGIIDPYLIENEGTVQSTLEIKSVGDIALEAGSLKVEFGGSSLSKIKDISSTSLSVSTITTTGDTTIGGKLTTGKINGNTLEGTKLVFEGSNPNIYPGTTNSGISLNANGTGVINIGTSSTGNIEFFSANNKITSSGNLIINGSYSVSSNQGQTKGACGASQYLGGVAVTGGIITTLGSCTSVSSSWSSLTDPTANLSLTMAAFTTTLTYNAATGTGNLFKLIDTTSNTGTGYLLDVETASSSNAKPIKIVARGSTILDTTAAGVISLGSNLLFSTDNTNDIGASGATRPRTGYFGTSLQVGSSLLTGGDINLGRGRYIGWNNSGSTAPDKNMYLEGGSTADEFRFYTNGANVRVAIGPTYISFPGLGSVASAGTVRLPNGTGSSQNIRARNAADTGDISLIGLNSSDEIEVGPLGNNTRVMGALTVGNGVSTHPTITTGLGMPNATYISFRNAANNAWQQVLTLNSSNITVLDNDGNGVVVGGGNSATAGTLRFFNNASILWRNQGNLLNITGLQVNSSNQVTLGDSNATGGVGVVMPGTQNTIALCHATNGVQTSPDNIVDCSGAPSDIAEWYETKDDVEVGDVVSPSSETITFKYAKGLGKVNGVEEAPLEGEDKTISILKRTDKGYDQSIIGVVSQAPYQTFGEDIKVVAKHPQRIALVGRVPVKVSVENGEIKIGDHLTSSSTKPGYSMKATKPGRIIGVALEPYDGPSTGSTNSLQASSGSGEKIMVFVNPSWYDPSIYIAENGDLSIKVDSIETKKLTISDDTNKEVLTATSSAKIATSSAQTLNDLNHLSGSILSRLDSLEKLVLSLSSLSVGGVGTQGGQLVSILSSIESKEATISGTLNVLGKTTVSDLGITGKITSGLLSINGLASKGESLQSYATIDTLSGDLYLQSLGVGGINFLSGKILIDKDGNLKILNTITAQKIEADVFASTKAAGSSTLPANTANVDVVSQNATETARILITPTVLTDKVLTVTNKTVGKFTVSVKQTDSQDIKFDWFIIQ